MQFPVLSVSAHTIARPGLRRKLAKKCGWGNGSRAVGRSVGLVVRTKEPAAAVCACVCECVCVTGALSLTHSLARSLLSPSLSPSLPLPPALLTAVNKMVIVFAQL